MTGKPIARSHILQKHQYLHKIPLTRPQAEVYLKYGFNICGHICGWYMAQLANLNTTVQSSRLGDNQLPKTSFFRRKTSKKTIQNAKMLQWLRQKRREKL